MRDEEGTRCNMFAANVPTLNRWDWQAPCSIDGGWLSAAATYDHEHVSS